MFTSLSVARSTPLLHALCLSALVLFGCACGADNDPGKVTGYVVKGVVRDAAGNPLPNVKVDAHDSLERISYVSGMTDANGAYRIKLDPERVTTYYVVATHKVRWDDQDWELALHPDNADPFNPEAGAVVNFTWKLSGPRSAGTFYGHEVSVYPELSGEELHFDDVEVDFAPSGPRIDGSEGEAFTLKLGESLTHEDIPLGRYTVTARYVPDPSVRLMLRPFENANSPWAESLETGFTSQGTFGTLRLTVSDVD